MNETDEQFPPRPGGLVDSARKAAAAPPAAQADTAQEFDGSHYDPIRTQLRVPEIASASTVVVSTTAGAKPVARILGEDGQRYKAIVMTLDQPVIVCFSRIAADDSRNAVNAAGLPAGGFVLPVNIPLPLDTSAEVFVAATSSTATRVSFIRQSFSL